MKRPSNRTILLALLVPAGIGIAAVTVFAQGPSAPQSFDMRGDQSSWINDPHMHDFYKATVDAFANGPARVDRAAYETRSREIFRALAVARNVPPEHLLNHLARIPGEMILIVTRDPKTLDSYDSFVVALFGPQRQGVGSTGGAPPAAH